MLIGSNNSLTYLNPCYLWLKPLKYLGRCQNIEYDKQYNYWGIRFFDFRLFVNKHNHIIIKNGTYEYNLFSFYEILDFLDKKGDVSILVTLDTSKGYERLRQLESIERKFIEACHAIETIYENIRFYGGYRRNDKVKLYSFEWEEKNGFPTIINPSEHSRLYRFVSKWCPCFIGNLNKSYIAKYDNEKGYLLLNYINRR